MEQSDSTGLVVTNEYDELGRVTAVTTTGVEQGDSVTIYYAYDLEGQVRFSIDGNGNKREYSYDQKGNKVLEGQSYVNDSDIEVIHTEETLYDLNGNVTGTISSVVNGSNTYLSAKSYVYDSFNRLIEVQEGAVGSPESRTIEKLTYDRNHRQTVSEIINQDGNGFNATHYTYDRNSNVVETVYPDGNHEVQVFNLRGQMTSKTDKYNPASMDPVDVPNLTVYTYDHFGNLIQVTDALGQITRYTYDLAGNLLSQTDAAGHTATYEYNVRNLLLRQVDHGGMDVIDGKAVYNPQKTETYSYEPNGLPASKTDRNGVTVSYTYDARGNILTETAGDQVVTFSYDSNGNLLTMTDETGVTAYAYDALNRTTVKYMPNFGQTCYVYDQVESGNLLVNTVTDPEDNAVSEVYNELGRLVEVRDDTDLTMYTYYANGSKQQVAYPDASKEVYSYTVMGQLTWLDHFEDDNGTDVLQNPNTDGHTYSYLYDNAGNQTEAKDIDDATVYTYDNLSRLSTVTEPGVDGTVTEYTFDKAGNRSLMMVTSGGETTTTVYTYNEQNRLLKETETDHLGNIKATEYKYDPNGNVIYQSDEILEIITENLPDVEFGMFVIGQGGAEELEYGIRLYEFNERNQLVSATTNGSIAYYTYDGLGRRVSKKVNGTTTYFAYSGDRIILEKTGTDVVRNIYGSNLIARDDFE